MIFINIWCLCFGLSLVYFLFEVFPLLFLLLVELALNAFIFTLEVLNLFVESRLVLEHVVELLLGQILVPPLSVRVKKHLVIHVGKLFLKFTQFVFQHLNLTVVVLVQILYLNLVFLLDCVQHFTYYIK